MFISHKRFEELERKLKELEKGSYSTASILQHRIELLAQYVYQNEIKAAKKKPTKKKG